MPTHMSIPMCMHCVYMMLAGARGWACLGELAFDVELLTHHYIVVLLLLLLLHTCTEHAVYMCMDMYGHIYRHVESYGYRHVRKTCMRASMVFELGAVGFYRVRPYRSLWAPSRVYRHVHRHVCRHVC